VGQAVQDLAKAGQDTGAGIWATVISAAVLVIGATSVFAQLQEALNLIWRVKPKEGRGLWDVIRDRIWSFAVVVVIGFLLLVSLVITTALAALAQYLPAALAWQVVNWLISFGLVTLLFALIYKILPDAAIDWEDVWVGAAVTALLFTVGKYLIGLYLGQSGVVSTYGAAGSLVVILLWVYYSSQILLFGAEFTHVYALDRRKPLRPLENAEAVAPAKPAGPEAARGATPRRETAGVHWGA
jgi:membrane protein